MIDHIGLQVKDYHASRNFYQQVLKALGAEIVMEVQGWAGFGLNGKPDFWIKQSEQMAPQLHVAFKAANRAQVDAFYQAALDAGAKDNGAPGVREIYHPNYYGAFVIDPDGHNIEAVCHVPA